MKKLLFACIILSLSPAANAAGAGDIDAFQQTAKEHLINLINIDTSQPEGSETKAARYIYKVFNEHNIDWDIYLPEKNRASISAVIKGKNRKEKPLILLSHLDTVAPTEKWTYPPFKATLEDGKIYGLGSTDDKNFTAAYLTIFTWFKKNKIKPERDIIFLATADEEAGSAVGLKWLTGSKNWSFPKQGAYALNEGGTILHEEGKAPIVFVEAATKMYMDLKITAYGAGGHSATQDKENNAVYNLTQALSKIGAMQMPLELTPFTRKFFSEISDFQDQDAQTTIEILLGNNKAESLMAAHIVAEDPFLKTQLQDTLVPTVLSSNAEPNVSAPEASAIINCRLLPSTDPDEFIVRIKTLFENDNNIAIEVLDKPKTPFPQPMDGNDDLFKSIEKAAQALLPGSKTILGMSPASSDSEILRRHGVITYGLGTTAQETEDSSDSGRSHSADEHITEQDFYNQLQMFLHVIYNFTVADDNLQQYFTQPQQ